MIESSFIKTHKYGGTGLDIYNGSYSLVSANEGKDGKIYAEWAYPQGPGKKPRETAVPVKVYLGDNPESAVNVLKAMIEAIHNEGGVPVESGVDDLGDDIPF